MTKIKTLWKNEHFKSIVFAISFVVFILVSLYYFSKLNLSGVDYATITGILGGLGGLFFPKLFTMYYSLDPDAKITKKHILIARLTGVILIVLSIGFWFFHNYYGKYI